MIKSKLRYKVLKLRKSKSKKSININPRNIYSYLNKKNYNFMGWQTVDIYQNLSITYLTSIRTNLEIDNDTFNLPKQNN